MLSASVSAPFVRKIGNSLQIGDLQQRVARRLHEDEARCGSHRSGEGVEISLVHLGRGNPQARQQILEEGRDATVGGPLPDHMVAGADQSQHGGGDDAHTGCRHQSSLGVLQLGDDRRDLEMVRVAVPGVEGLPALLDRRACEALRIFGPEGRGLKIGVATELVSCTSLSAWTTVVLVGSDTFAPYLGVGQAVDSRRTYRVGTMTERTSRFLDPSASSSNVAASSPILKESHNTVLIVG